jgi:thiol-disulfide isomerase/thioredoxin
MPTKGAIQMKLATFCMSVFLALSVQAADEPAKPAEQPAAKLWAVYFHADWCGSCRALQANLELVRDKLAALPVLNIKLDLTDDTTKQQARWLAEALGLQAVFEEHGQKTGFILLVQPEGKTVREKITKQLKSEEILAAYQKQLNH